MAHVWQTLWSALRFLWEGIVSFIKDTPWFWVGKVILTGLFVAVGIAVPWMMGMEVAIKKMVENAGYTAANLHTFTPTVKEWWLAENSPIIIVSLIYIIFALILHIWISSPIKRK